MTANVSEGCQRIHAAVDRLPRYTGSSFHVPFDNGLYFFFEQDEKSQHGHAGQIVRMGRREST